MRKSEAANVVFGPASAAACVSLGGSQVGSIRRLSTATTSDHVVAAYPFRADVDPAHWWLLILKARQQIDRSDTRCTSCSCP
jgi:hypothetical protein